MEFDDDIFVVIIGDEDERSSNVKIKEENFDETSSIKVEHALETAEKHGQLIEFDLKKEIKKENIEEYLEKEIEFDDDEYIPNTENSEDDVESGDEKANRQRHAMLKSWQRKSFVNELRQQYPKMRNDQNLLIDTLANVMRNVKPPPPPKDFCFMNDVMYECVKCGFISETMPAASRHYREKHGKRYLVCYACGVDFRSTTNLYKHEKRCSAPDAVVVLKARALCLGRKGRGRPFLLNPDDIKRRRKNQLVPASLRSVPQKKSFICMMCPGVFSSKPSLLAHEHTHTGERPYQCKLCPAAYTSRCGLKKHWYKHTDIEFICDHCARSFKAKAALVTHLDTHLPQKRFPCELCDRRYATRAALKLHFDRTHLNLPPPFPCQLCPRRFPRMSLLKDHMKKVHGMLLMTRKMFFKTLPTISETQLQQAKVVLKSEVAEINYDPKISYADYLREIDETQREEMLGTQLVKTQVCDRKKTRKITRKIEVPQEMDETLAEFNEEKKEINEPQELHETQEITETLEMTDTQEIMETQEMMETQEITEIQEITEVQEMEDTEELQEIQVYQSEETDSTELSEEVVQHIQKLQEEAIKDSKNVRVVVIQNGKIISVNDSKLEGKELLSEIEAACSQQYDEIKTENITDDENSDSKRVNNEETNVEVDPIEKELEMMHSNVKVRNINKNNKNKNDKKVNDKVKVETIQTLYEIDDLKIMSKQKTVERLVSDLDDIVNNSEKKEIVKKTVNVKENKNSKIKVSVPRREMPKRLKKGIREASLL